MQILNKFNGLSLKKQVFYCYLFCLFNAIVGFATIIFYLAIIFRQNALMILSPVIIIVGVSLLTRVKYEEKNEDAKIEG